MKKVYVVRLTREEHDPLHPVVCMDETPQRLQNPSPMAVHYRGCTNQTSQLLSVIIRLTRHW